MRHIGPRLWLTLFLAAAVLVGIGLLAGWTFRDQPSIRHREILLTRLQAIQRLDVLEARLLAHETRREPALLNTNEFLIVARGKAIYGVDLSRAKLDAADGRARLDLPAVRMQDLIVNPADLEFLGLKKGLMTSQADFETLKRQAAIDLQRELARQARDPALLTQAETNARSYLQTLLTSLGYPEAEIRFENAPGVVNP